MCSKSNSSNQTKKSNLSKLCIQGTWALHTIRFASCVNRTEAHMLLFLQTFNLFIFQLLIFFCFYFKEFSFAIYKGNKNYSDELNSIDWDNTL